MAAFDEIPCNLLEGLIFPELSLSERIQNESVCRKWNSVMPYYDVEALAPIQLIKEISNGICPKLNPEKAEKILTKCLYFFLRIKMIGNHLKFLKITAASMLFFPQKNNFLWRTEPFVHLPLHSVCTCVWIVCVQKKLQSTLGVGTFSVWKKQ